MMNEFGYCKHEERFFITSWTGVGTGRTERGSIHVCKGCGLIMIRSEVNGQVFDREFHIHQSEVLDAMRQWTDLVESAKGSAK